MRLIGETNINFLEKRKITLYLSVALILLGLVSMIFKGGPSYGIDFLGGTEVHVQFQQQYDVKEVREAITSLGFGKAEIKQFGTAQDYLIRIQQQESGTKISDSIIDALKQSFPNDTPNLLSVDSVGPKIGKELRTSAAKAVLFSLALILLYISIRFELIFAVGAVIALFHDVIITLGLFSLLNLEISLAVVAAFLTLVGYSLNDTIVVFDRIRENFNLLRRESSKTEHVINLSINQTLSRTILTSGTTLVVVLILYIFGGEVIHNFAFCMLVGILVGTYSSMFVAAPVISEWHKKHEVTKVKKKKPAKA